MTARAEGVRPAAAYMAVAEILAPEFFLRPAPPEGARLHVTGSDNVRTTWDMGVDTARQLCAHLSSRRDLVIFAEQYRS